MIGGNPAVSKASPVRLSGVLRISAPEQSDSAGGNGPDNPRSNPAPGDPEAP